MAINLLSHVVSDLCLGKPALKSLSKSSSISDALFALNNSEDNFISIWNCDCDCDCDCENNNSSSNSSTITGNNHNPIGIKNRALINDDDEECQCIGKISMADIICYLCKGDNLSVLSTALESPVSVILNKKKNTAGFVKHVQPSTSLLEAIDLMLQGAHNLILPIQTTKSKYTKRKQELLSKPSTTPNQTSTIHKNYHEYCWLTQEDVIRFILNRIGLFTPIPALSLETLGIIRTDVPTLNYHAPASTALDSISIAISEQTSIALVDEDGILVSEISPCTLACCDETIGPAIMTLSCGDLMAYIDWGGPPEDLVKVVTSRLRERNLDTLLELLELDVSSSSSSSGSSSVSLAASSDDESSSLSSSGSIGLSSKSRRHSRSGSYSAQMARRAEGIACHPKSSLVAVMIQAIAHRVNYAWVVEDDGSLVGIVTFFDMLKVFREELESMVEWES